MKYTFDDCLQEELKDPEFRKAYEELQPETVLIQALIDERNKGLTRKMLAKRTGLRKKDIKRIESGDLDMSFRKLQKLVEGLGKIIHIELVKL